MTPPLAAVLYEDDGDPKRFGPHALILACVSDVIGVDRHVLRRHFEPILAGGDANLRAACRDDLSELVDRWHAVVALFDDDKVRRLLRLPHQACKREVLERICADAASQEAFLIVLLVRNMETLVREAGLLLGLAPEKLRKNTGVRDRVLHRAAAADRRVRDALLDRIPSARRLVDLLVRIWTEGGSANRGPRV